MIILCVVVTMFWGFSSVANADDSYQNVTWSQVALDTLINGAVSYDKNNGNVVVSGTAFYDTIHADGSYLGTQLVGGDGIDLEVEGNFAMYGLFTYTDAANVLCSAASNPSQMLAFEIVANDLKIDLDSDGNEDLVDRYALDTHDVEEIDFLKATFAELGNWGYTELAPGVWFDLAIQGDVPAGQIAMSIVIAGFQNDGFDALCAAYEMDVINASLLPCELGEGLAGVRRDSGVFVAEIPEPATMSLLALSGLAVIRKRRK